MRRLIGDLLDTGRIEAGTLSVTPEPSEVADLVERARTTFPSGGGGRHAVLVNLPAGLPAVMADRRRIVQVLNNLVANATRHAPELSPIRVAAAREQALVAVSVSDEGPGVAPERLQHLFRRRADAGQGATAGHGLGLALCKGLVEAHDGRIRAQSAGPGRGATFAFTVPVTGEPGAAAAHRAAVPPPAANRGWAAPRSRRGRRSADAALHPRCTVGGRLRPARDRRGREPRAHHPHGEAASSPARFGAARQRRHRADALTSRALRPAGHLHLRLPPR